MKNTNVKRMVGIAILSAIVVILQLLGSFIHFGPMVSVTLVLIPIVIGAAVYGPAAGAFLGGVFSLVVLTQPDTVFFYGIHFLGTVLTVMLKGVLAGYLAGLTFRAFSRVNEILAVFLAAVICPLVNTGIFFLGCRAFFWEAINEISNGNAMQYVITAMIGVNFLAEFAANIICAPVVLRILNAIKKAR